MLRSLLLLVQVAALLTLAASSSSSSSSSSSDEGEGQSYEGIQRYALDGNDYVLTVPDLGKCLQFFMNYFDEKNEDGSNSNRVTLLVRDCVQGHANQVVYRSNSRKSTVCYCSRAYTSSCLNEVGDAVIPQYDSDPTDFALNTDILINGYLTQYDPRPVIVHDKDESKGIAYTDVFEIQSLDLEDELEYDDGNSRANSTHMEKHGVKNYIKLATTWPTPSPTKSPTPKPTVSPTMSPTYFPTPFPGQPTPFPTPEPSESPTPYPTKAPLEAGETHSPTAAPTSAPVEQDAEVLGLFFGIGTLLIVFAYYCFF
ncbi:Hypothetical Protein FCC1311_058162 [Hondaea fermentalgiana]|uniref:Uncharacterized protein n=1 Tax=Hondaea fermentalgiana TaxID=2315210 RepID=A0A2R5GG70_9STRA|nr:Hypothetical Protein FCC1311_058162 [Hondaea fermentalgiana]|eukprot:GBG29595.1 Hypothetical Protein FCC1311_058162 [Hondaea fermentalgiana]